MGSFAMVQIPTDQQFLLTISQTNVLWDWTLLQLCYETYVEKEDEAILVLILSLLSVTS